MSISFFEPPPTPKDEHERGEAVRESGVLGLATDPVLVEITKGVCRGLQVGASLLSVVHQDTQYVVAAHGFSMGAYGRKYSFSGHAIAANEDIFFVSDLSADDRFADNPWVSGSAGVFRFYAAALIRTSANHVIGVISAVDPAPRLSLSSVDRKILLDAASAAAARIEHLRSEPKL